MRARAIGRGIPVRTALVARKHGLSGRLRSLDWPAVRVQPAGPVHFDERTAAQELSIGAIERIKEAIAIGPCHELARSPVPERIDQYRNLYGVEVRAVVRRELKIPLQFSGIGI